LGERIISNRAGRAEGVETQLSRLILEVREGADALATTARAKSILEPYHPKIHVEVVILKPENQESRRSENLEVRQHVGRSL
jgi:hypothetical protein